MKRIIFPLLAVLVLSCNRGVGKEEVPGYDRNNFFVVDYESVLNNKVQVNLSELTDDIEYIKLETNENCLLHPRAEYFFTDDYIFIDNSTHILQFDRKGKFIRQIGKQGRGPGEIGLIRVLSVLDEQNQLVVQTNWARKLYYFSYEGVFLKSVKVKDVRRIKAIPGKRLVYFAGCVYGYEDYMFALVNTTGDTLDVVNNHYKWENKTGRVGTMSYHLFVPFYFYNNTISFKSMHNDTVYHVSGDSIKPEYLIELGKYQLPQEERVEVPSSGSFPEFGEKSKAYRFCSVFEADESLFISSTGYQDKIYYYMIYKKPTGSGKLLVDNNNDPGMIINDIDGGPDFWPLGTVNDSTVYMPVLPLDMLNKDFRDKLINAEGVDPEKKNELIQMIDGLNENDNPVLMIVRLK
ncbi:MAG TPA: hypothetical protein DEQ09_02730 [Bacteroidales bacterium]|nr:hypothetical protein [Bacteroidales bacterium]